MTSQKKDEVCRLCLIVDAGNYLQLDEISKESLKVVIPELNLDVPADFVVCSKCSQSIEESFKLKTIISKNQDLILLEKEKLKISDKVDLNHIFEMDANTTGSNERKCRFCFNKNEDNYTDLNDIAIEVFETCLSELDKDLTVNPVICELCHKGLQDMHSFKTQCLCVENKIKSYCESVSNGKVDLQKVLNSSKDEDTDFLAGFEIQDEEEGDIFNSIPSELNVIQNDRKRPASESHVVEPSKKPKLHDEKFHIAKDGLPRFNCPFTALSNCYRTQTVSKWLTIVEEIKVKENWSDYITINKVLARMNHLHRLYTWFKNISDVMTWEDWKQKLINAFPLKDDCAYALKRMFDRKKKAKETFVCYYNAKLQLLEPHNIVGEKAVSCILGGIKNNLIASIGRVGQYKTPEELLIYFKSCDDKAAMESTQTNAGNKELDQSKGKSNEMKMEKSQCSKCHKPGHKSEMCMSKTPSATNIPSGGKVSSKKEAKRKFLCRFCGMFGHKVANCTVRMEQKHIRRHLKVISNDSTNANTNSSPNSKKGPSNPYTIKGPNKPNVNKRSNKLNPNIGTIKQSTNKGPLKTNVINSPVGTNMNIRPGLGPTNRPNSNRVPIWPNRDRSPNRPNLNITPNSPNINRSPNRPNINSSPNRPSMNSDANKSSMNRDTNTPTMNRDTNRPNRNRGPNVPSMNKNSNASYMNRSANDTSYMNISSNDASYMNRSSNGLAPNRGLNEVTCSYCGNLGHNMVDCISSNFVRQSDTFHQDRQSDRYFPSASGERDASGQNYGRSYFDRKKLFKNRSFCLHCYQLGHDTKECTRYDCRPYAR